MDALSLCTGDGLRAGFHVTQDLISFALECGKMSIKYMGDFGHRDRRVLETLLLITLSAISIDAVLTALEKE